MGRMDASLQNNTHIVLFIANTSMVLPFFPYLHHLASFLWEFSTALIEKLYFSHVITVSLSGRLCFGSISRAFQWRECANLFVVTYCRPLRVVLCPLPFKTREKPRIWHEATTGHVTLCNFCHQSSGVHTGVCVKGVVMVIAPVTDKCCICFVF